MVALLRPPPKALLAKSKAMSVYNWPHMVSNDAGEVCNNAQQFFRGPFFNEEGWSEASVSPKGTQSLSSVKMTEMRSCHLFEKCLFGFQKKEAQLAS
ncbi:hypothetical protein N7470_007237 [Penicillium chermesinum]|nr:hypothetical protein N7470_007237 [Penicillium chermesinum]